MLQTTLTARLRHSATNSYLPLLGTTISLVLFPLLYRVGTTSNWPETLFKIPLMREMRVFSSMQLLLIGQIPLVPAGILSIDGTHWEPPKKPRQVMGN